MTDGHSLLCAWHMGKVCDCGYADSVPADVSATRNIAYASVRSAALQEAAKDALSEAVEALRNVERDAARYRFLRRLDHFGTVDAMLNTMDYHTLDAAVDAAMAQSEKLDNSKPKPL